MLRTEVIDSSLLELKDELEYMKLTELLEFLPPRKQSLASLIYQKLKLAIEQEEINQEAIIFDLTDFDPLFSFSAPPSLPLFHLSKALKEMSAGITPEIMKKYTYIGFNREQIGRILEVDFYTAEQRQSLSLLNQQIQQARASEAIENAQTVAAEQDDLRRALQQEQMRHEHTKQMLAVVLDEYSKTQQGHKLLHGGKISKSKVAVMTTISELQSLFKHPKGEQTYRKDLSFLNLSQHFIA